MPISPERSVRKFIAIEWLPDRGFLWGLGVDGRLHRKAVWLKKRIQNGRVVWVVYVQFDDKVRMEADSFSEWKTAQRLWGEHMKRWNVRW